MQLPRELENFVIEKWIFEDAILSEVPADQMPQDPVMTELIREQLASCGIPLEQLLDAVSLCEPDLDGLLEPRGGGYYIDI
jgi:hypothetical protein